MSGWRQFWRGFIRALDLAGASSPPPLGGIADDWRKVGEDLGKCLPKSPFAPGGGEFRWSWDPEAGVWVRGEKS